MMTTGDNTSLTLVLATRNEDKIREIRRVLGGTGYEIRTLSEVDGLHDIEEDGATIRDNAIKKAQVVAEHTGLMALADDTGLEVDALDGAPGVFSSRFAGQNVSYSDNNRKLLADLNGVPRDKRTARFRCVVAVADSTEIYTVEGVCEGVILETTRGEGGFGYDPVFLVPEEGRTFAEMDVDHKNRISHRGLALRKARALLQELAAHADSA
jgi:XTP/dITP diphosphohydrolase